MFFIQNLLSQYPYNTLENLAENLLLFDRAEDDFDPICLKGKYWDLVKWDIENIVNEYKISSAFEYS